MSKLSPFLLLVTLFSLLLFLAGCGNKGELIRESDQAAAEELEREAQKLKKEKKEPTQPAE